MDLADTSRRFLDGLAVAAGLGGVADLDDPGTSVVGGDDRAGTGSLACYRTAHHLVVWGDPAVVDRATDLAGPATLTVEAVALRLEAAGFALRASVISNLLDGPPPSPPSVPAGYAQRWLDGTAPSTIDAVRAFTERCDPDDVDAADLDELDDFDEAAINVLTPDPEPDAPVPHVVAYASASPWEWAPDFADIGVLVHADHRRRGLANLVVASTVDRLLADGRLPLYRHEVGNVGSAAVAAGLGFRPVARLDYFVTEAAAPGPDRSTGSG